MLHASVRRLEVFLAVADTGSFSAAAERLGIAQPSVSEHVKALEAECHGVLLERRPGRPPQLTETGIAIAKRARRMLAHAAKMAHEAADMRRTAERRIVLAAQRYVANFILPTRLAHFVREHPEFELVIQAGGQEDVLDQIASGRADLGCFLTNTPPAGMKTQKIGRERFAIVASPSHPLAKGGAIPPKELKAYKFVRGPQRSLLSQELDRMLAAIGITRVLVASRTTEYNMVRELVASGVGVWCTLAKSVEQDLRAGTLVELALDAPPLMMDVQQVLSSRRQPTKAARTLAKYLHADATHRQRAGRG